ncbi:MAG: phosphatase PAP2 family protein [Bacilli bacterium]
MSLIYASNVLGTWLTKQYLTIWSDNVSLANGIGYLTSTLITLAEAFILNFLLCKELDTDYVLKLAIMIFIVVIFSELIGNFFKSMISRPRYRNIVATDSTLTFSSWWQFHFWTTTSDATRSCPSGHMIVATMMMIIPLFHPLWKFRLRGGEYVSFSVASAIVLLIGFFRIYNGAHFLSDVSFGILITFALMWVTDFFFFHQKRNSEEPVFESVLIKVIDN